MRHWSGIQWRTSTKQPLLPKPSSSFSSFGFDLIFDDINLVVCTWRKGSRPYIYALCPKCKNCIWLLVLRLFLGTKEFESAFDQVYMAEWEWEWEWEWERVEAETAGGVRWSVQKKIADRDQRRNEKVILDRMRKHVVLLERKESESLMERLIDRS